VFDGGAWRHLPSAWTPGVRADAVAMFGEGCGIDSAALINEYQPLDRRADVSRAREPMKEAAAGFPISGSGFAANP